MEFLKQCSYKSFFSPSNCPVPRYHSRKRIKLYVMKWESEENMIRSVKWLHQTACLLKRLLSALTKVTPRSSTEPFTRGVPNWVKYKQSVGGHVFKVRQCKRNTVCRGAVATHLVVWSLLIVFLLKVKCPYCWKGFYMVPLLQDTKSEVLHDFFRLEEPR